MFFPKGLSDRGITLGSFLQLGVHKGLGSNKIIETLRKAGAGYRRSTMLSDIRQYVIARNKTEAIQRLPNHVIPPKDYFVETMKSRIPKRYVYTYKSKYYSTKTKQLEDFYVTGQTDRLMSKADMMNRIENSMNISDESKKRILENHEIVEAYRGMRP